MNQSGEQLSQNDPARASFSPWRTASHAQQRCGLPENSRAGRPGAPGRQPVACRSKGLRRRRHSGQLVNSFSFGPPKKTKRRRKWPLAGEVARPPLFWTMEPCAAVHSPATDAFLSGDGGSYGEHYLHVNVKTDRPDSLSGATYTYWCVSY